MVNTRVSVASQWRTSSCSSRGKLATELGCWHRRCLERLTARRALHPHCSVGERSGGRSRLGLLVSTSREQNEAGQRYLLRCCESRVPSVVRKGLRQVLIAGAARERELASDFRARPRKPTLEQSGAQRPRWAVGKPSELDLMTATNGAMGFIPEVNIGVLQQVSITVVWWRTNRQVTTRPHRSPPWHHHAHAEKKWSRARMAVVALRIGRLPCTSLV